MGRLTNSPIHSTRHRSMRHAVWLQMLVSQTLLFGLLAGFMALSIIPAQADSAGANEMDATRAESGYLYWHNGNTIYRTWADGTGTQAVVQGMPLRSPAFNAAADTLYGLGDDGVLRRANADGTELTELLAAGDANPSNLRLDEAGGKLYWTESISATEWHILRANLDGSQVMTVATGLDNPIALTLHPAGGKLYWIDDAGSGKIARADMDGGAVEDVYANDPEATSVGCLQIDPVAQKLYWQVRETGFLGPILRANLDGSGQETLSLAEDICPILDVEGRMLYWRTTESPPMLIQRSQLDGTGVETLREMGEFELVNNLTVVPETQELYWTMTSGANSHMIQRMDLDGSEPETLIDFTDENALNVIMPTGFRVDAVPQRFYWEHRSQLHSANLDGNDLATVVTGVYRPRLPVVDAVQERLYWIDRDHIYAARMDGPGIDWTSIETPFSFSDHMPGSLTLDVANQTLYWIAFAQEDDANARIERAPLDSLEVEVLGEFDADTLVGPYLLDPAGMKLYGLYGYSFFPEPEPEQGIGQMALDGSGLALLISLPSGDRPLDLALDGPNNMLYWTRGLNNGKIERADLEEGEATEWITDLLYPGLVEIDAQNEEIYWTARTEEEGNDVVWRALLADGEPAMFLEERAMGLWFDPAGVQVDDDPPGDEETYSVFAPALLAD